MINPEVELIQDAQSVVVDVLALLCLIFALTLLVVSALIALKAHSMPTENEDHNEGGN